MRVWAVHFLGVYGLASIAAVFGVADASVARVAVGILTALCLLADAALGVSARRRLEQSSDDLERFMAWGGGLCARISAIAVIWQGLPAAVGH